MGLQQRPGITTTENLISTPEENIPYIPTVGFLSAERGPGNKNTIVVDQVDFIEKFGFPTQYNYKSWYNIYEYLRYTNYINVMRVIDTTWQNYGKEFGNSITAVEKTDFYNNDIAFNTIVNNYSHGVDNVFASVMNREITDVKDIAVAFCMTEDDYDLDITTENDVLLFEDVWTSVPTQLQRAMDAYQLYVLNTGGVHTVKQIQRLTDEDIVEVNTIGSGPYYTEIKIANNDDLWSDATTFTYTELYFRDTKRNDLNDTSVTITGTYVSSGETGGAAVKATDPYIYIVLDENLSLYDTTGEVVFYDSTSDDVATVSVSEGYLKSVEKYFTINDSDELVYANTDDEFEYVENGEYNSEAPQQPLCTRIAYDAKIQNSSDIKTFREIFNKDMDFNRNFCFLVFKKYSGKFSLMEAYEVAKERDTSINALYKRNYCEDIINQNSKYVYFIKNTSTISETITTNTVSITDLVLEADDDTTDFTDLDTYSTFETATNFYRNVNNISFRYLLGIQLDDGVNNMNLSPSIANDRKDCIAIISPWDENEFLDNYDNMTNTLVYALGIKNNPVYLTENNTYTIVYDNMKMIYSEFLEEYKWISTIGDIAGVYVNEDFKNPYSASAGYRTTPIKNILKMLHTNVSDDNRDLLCYNSINHIIKNYEDNEFYLYDILMYYDNDVLTKRLNIRKTLNYFKYELRQLLKPYIYEQNSYTIQQEVSSNINSIILNMIDVGALYNGYAICNSTNNSPNTINENELHIQITLQPTQVIRQIYIEINIEKQSLNISETEI